MALNCGVRNAGDQLETDIDQSGHAVDNYEMRPSQYQEPPDDECACDFGGGRDDVPDIGDPDDFLF